MEPQASLSYAPSGRINWPHFLPLAGASLVLSFVLAYALYRIGRLLLEGVRHRYVVRARDVTCLRPPARGSGVNVELRFRVGPEELALVITRPNMPRTIIYGLSRYPLLGWPLRPLVERSSPRFARHLANALNIPVTEAPAPSVTSAPTLTPAAAEGLQSSLDTSC